MWKLLFHSLSVDCVHCNCIWINCLASIMLDQFSVAIVFGSIVFCINFVGPIVFCNCCWINFLLQGRFLSFHGVNLANCSYLHCLCLLLQGAISPKSNLLKTLTHHYFHIASTCFTRCWVQGILSQSSEKQISSFL